MELNREQSDSSIKYIEDVLENWEQWQTHHSKLTNAMKDLISLANKLTEENERLRAKGEWISVKDRMPDTTLKKITICDQDIGSGAVVSEKVVEAQVSETVAVICHLHIGGEFKDILDYDNTVNGEWANTMGATHWMPLPGVPIAKEMLEGEDGKAAQ